MVDKLHEKLSLDPNYSDVGTLSQFRDFLTDAENAKKSLPEFMENPRNSVRNAPRMRFGGFKLLELAPRGALTCQK